jgi:hypothetical protein
VPKAMERKPGSEGDAGYHIFCRCIDLQNRPHWFEQLTRFRQVDSLPVQATLGKGSGGK